MGVVGRRAEIAVRLLSRFRETSCYFNVCHSGRIDSLLSGQ